MTQTYVERFVGIAAQQNGWPGAWSRSQNASDTSRRSCRAVSSDAALARTSWPTVYCPSDSLATSSKLVDAVFAIPPETNQSGSEPPRST